MRSSEGAHNMYKPFGARAIRQRTRAGEVDDSSERDGYGCRRAQPSAVDRAAATRALHTVAGASKPGSGNCSQQHTPNAHPIAVMRKAFNCTERVSWAKEK